MLALALVFACQANKVQNLSQLVPGPAIAAVFPPEGTQHVNGEVPIVVLLGAVATNVLPTVTVAVDGNHTDVTCTLVQAGAEATCGPLEGVTDKSEKMRMTVTVGDSTEEVTAYTAPPPKGVGWDLLANATIEEFGGNDNAINFMQTAIGNSHLFVTPMGYLGSEGDVTLAGGPAIPGEAPILAVLQPGLTLIMPGHIDANGRFSGHAHSMWMSMPVNGVTVTFLVLDATLDGDIVNGTLQNFTFDSAVPALSLLEITAPLGDLQDDVLNIIGLNADTDGDLHPDSASFIATGNADAATLVTWQ